MATSSGTPARSAAEFVNSLGINVHLGNWAIYEINTVKSSLSYLGINKIRDGLQTASNVQSAYGQLSSAGVKFDFIIPNGMNLATFKNQLDRFVTSHPGSLAAIEGPNEVDREPYNYNGNSSLEADGQFQKDLYSAVKSDPLLKNTYVYNTTVVEPWNYPALGNLAPWTDAANVHAYVWTGTTPAEPIKDYITRSHIDAPGKWTMFTETGYSTLSGDSGSVTEMVAAKYTLNTILDAFYYGIGSTYLYELFDEADNASNTDRAGYYGLFHKDGTPKIGGTAIHNLTSILGDQDGGATDTLNFGVSGLPSNGNDLLLEKSDGSFDLVVWAEPNIWNPTTFEDIQAPTIDAAVNFDTLENVKVYDPMIGTTPIETSIATKSVLLHLVDHPLIVEIRDPLN